VDELRGVQPLDAERNAPQHAPCAAACLPEVRGNRPVRCIGQVGLAVGAVGQGAQQIPVQVQSDAAGRPLIKVARQGHHALGSVGIEPHQTRIDLHAVIAIDGAFCVQALE